MKPGDRVRVIDAQNNIAHGKMGTIVDFNKEWGTGDYKVKLDELPANRPYYEKDLELIEAAKQPELLLYLVIASGKNYIVQSKIHAEVLSDSLQGRFFEVIDFNPDPNSDLNYSVTYKTILEEIPGIDDTLRFSLPCEIIPRYSPDQFQAALEYLNNKQQIQSLTSLNSKLLKYIAALGAESKSSNP